MSATATKTFSMPFEGGMIHGESEDMVRAVVADLQRRKLHEQERNRRYPGTERQKMTALCKSFPSLAESAQGIEPWNTDKFLLWAVAEGASSGAMHAARFCLNVWNCSSDWVELLTTVYKRRDSDQEDDTLWNGLQQLKRSTRRSLEDQERETARENRRAPLPVSEDCVDEVMLKSFGVVHSFNAVAAIGTWDDKHRKAFLSWAEYPFWP